MTQTKDVALFTREQFDEPKNFMELLDACKVLVASKILPKEIDTPEKAAVVILTGRELGLRMMASTRSVYVVNGKPSLSAQMMLSLAYATKELEDIDIQETGKGEAASCTVTVKRKGKTPYVYTFTVDMAKKMGKYANEWIKQPENMAKQRALSGNLRVTFPDAILGMYTTEEIDTIEIEPVKPVVEMPRALKPEAPPVSVSPETVPTPAPDAKAPETAPKEEIEAETRPLPPGFILVKAKNDMVCKGSTCGKAIKLGEDAAFHAKKGPHHPDCAQ